MTIAVVGKYGGVAGLLLQEEDGGVPGGGREAQAVHEDNERVRRRGRRGAFGGDEGIGEFGAGFSGEFDI